MNDSATLPHNLESELAVLEAVLRDNATLSTARRIITANDFFRDGHKAVFASMCDMADRGVEIETIPLCEELERIGKLDSAGGPAYVGNIVSSTRLYRDASEYITANARTIAGHAQRRRLIFELELARQLAYAKEPIPEIAGQVRSAIEAIGVSPGDSEGAQHEWQITTELRKQRALVEAKRRLASERFGTAKPPAVKSLRELMAEPDPPQEWLIDRLFPADALVLLVAMGKSGKTTLRNNLLRSLVDGASFLGDHRVHRAGPVFVFDMEMSERQTKKWLGAVGIRNLDDLKLVSLRGATETFNLFDAESFNYWAARVRETGARTLVLDTLKPALDACGLNEREDGGRYLRMFGTFMAACGVSDSLICHHTGWAANRARGDSALLDVPDATWMLTRDKDDKSEVKDMAGTRSFQAYGRDVDFPKTDLVYAPESRLLSLALMSTQESKADRGLGIICGIVSRAPNHPLSQTAICETYAPLEALAKAPAKLALEQAIERGLIRRITGKTRGSFHHAITPQGADFLSQRSSAPQHSDHSGAVPLQRPTPYKGGAVDAGEVISNSSAPVHSTTGGSSRVHL